jgi:phosphoribosylformylglycinamidine cyclo-ligase
MGDVYKTNGFDLEGFAIGTVSKNNILPKNIEEGDIILGIKSNGLHSNGYSLVRKILRYSEYDIDELLKPTRIYN